MRVGPASEQVAKSHLPDKPRTLLRTPGRYFFTAA
jgi:hypothetical protein